MATKKSDEVKTEEVKVAEDPWLVMKEIRLPKEQNGDTDLVFAAVNGRKFYIRRGVTETVPLPIYEVLVNAMQAEDEADEFRVSRGESRNLGVM